MKLRTGLLRYGALDCTCLGYEHYTLALALNYNLQLSQIDGGSLRNAIPRESVAKIVVDSKDFLNQLDSLAAEIKSEFFKSEPDLIIEVNNIDSITHGISKIDSKNLRRKKISFSTKDLTAAARATVEPRSRRVRKSARRFLRRTRTVK